LVRHRSRTIDGPGRQSRTSRSRRFRRRPSRSPTWRKAVESCEGEGGRVAPTEDPSP